MIIKFVIVNICLYLHVHNSFKCINHSRRLAHPSCFYYFLVMDELKNKFKRTLCSSRKGRSTFSVDHPASWSHITIRMSKNKLIDNHIMLTSDSSWRAERSLSRTTRFARGAEFPAIYASFLTWIRLREI